MEENEVDPWDIPSPSAPVQGAGRASGTMKPVSPSNSISGPNFEDDAYYLRIGACALALLVALVPAWVTTTVADTGSSARLFSVPLFGPLTIAALVASFLVSLFADKVAGVNAALVAFVNLFTTALCVVAIAISDMAGTTADLSFSKLFGQGPPANMAISLWAWVCLVLCLVAGLARPLVASGGASGEYRERYLISAVVGFVAVIALIWSRYVTLITVVSGRGKVGLSAADVPVIAPITSMIVLLALVSLFVAFITGWLSFWIPAALGLLSLGLSMSATSIDTFVSPSSFAEFLSVDNAPPGAEVELGVGVGWMFGALAGLLLMAAAISLALVPERPTPARIPRSGDLAGSAEAGGRPDPVSEIAPAPSGSAWSSESAPPGDSSTGAEPVDPWGSEGTASESGWGSQGADDWGDSG